MNVFLFSGGYDSTCAIISVLKETPPSRVRLLTIESPIMSQGNKLSGEAEARKKILKILKRDFPHFEFQTIVIHTDIYASDACEDSAHKLDAIHQHGLLQPQTWIMNALYTLEPGDTLYCGYIGGDEAAAHIEDIENFFEADINLAFIGNEKPKIQFPILSVSKAEVLKRLYEFDPDLLHACFSCESAFYTGARCLQCKPCRHLEYFLLEIVRSPSFPKKLRKWAKRKLKNEYDMKLPKIKQVDARLSARP